MLEKEGFTLSLQEVIKDQNSVSSRTFEKNNIDDDTYVNSLSDKIDGQDALVDLDENTLNQCIGAGNGLTIPKVATNPSVSLAQLARIEMPEKAPEGFVKSIGRRASRFIDSEFGKTSTAGIVSIGIATGSYYATKAWKKTQKD